MMSRRVLTSSAHQRGGFTLLELLVVIGLIGVITTWGYVILFRIDSEWNDLRRRAELSAAADTVIATMRADFDAMVSPVLAGIPVSGAERTYQDPRRLMFDDTFSLPITAPDGPQVHHVRYFVDRVDGRSLLTREATAIATAASVSTALYPQVDVAYLRCEFASESESGGIAWVYGWDRPEPPTAIRISMTLTNPDFPHIQVSRKAVFDVPVQ